MKIRNIILTLFTVTFLMSCGAGGGQKHGTEQPQTLNISVFLDLSDRIADRNLVPNQVYRDTAIINYLIEYFISKTLGIHILQSENKMKVFFYPTPQDTRISELSKLLSVDIGSKNGVEKRTTLEAMRTVFPATLDSIYSKTLASNKWPGCDIWDFFSSKKVDNLCVKNGARNIVVILTDGYIYHEKNAFQEGDAYSYIGHKKLDSKQEISLIDRRKGELAGKGLEVLMLEVNPAKPAHKDKMMKILEKWFSDMGVEKFVAAETDANLTNTETIIKNFLDN